MNDIQQKIITFKSTIPKGPKIECRIDCIPFSSFKMYQFKKSGDEDVENADSILAII